MRNLCEEFKHYRGQPLEVICSNNIKICGIVVESGDESAVIIDHKCRMVRIEYRHIITIIEPQMRLNRLCSMDDCQCGHEHDYDDDENGCYGCCN